MNWPLNHIKPGSLTVTLSKTFKKYYGTHDVYLLEAENEWAIRKKKLLEEKGEKMKVIFPPLKCLGSYFHRKLLIGS